MSKIKLYWWNEEPNFGDALTPLLLEKLFDIESEWTPLETAELVGAGSCLQWVSKAVMDNPHEMHIWGSGYMFDKEPPVDSELVTHHAVRGKQSQLYGGLKEVALGDPGILSSYLLDKPPVKRFRVGVVPHLWNIHDPLLGKAIEQHSDVLLIDVRLPALKVVEQIASCEFIYSSSLHGLIVADSFRIPNQHVEFEKKLFGGGWKFVDYYSVYDISEQRPLQFDATNLSLDFTNNLIEHFEVRNGLKEQKQNLIDSFPLSHFRN